MLVLHQAMLYLHIILGSVALVVFWVPIAARKGGSNHVLFGKIYVWSMYLVATSGILMSLMVLVHPAFFKAGLLQDATSAKDMLRQIYYFWSLLLFLSLLTFVSVRQAMLVLKHKRNTQVFRHWSYLWMPAIMFLGGVSLISMAVISDDRLILHYIFGGIGLISGVQMRRFAFEKNATPKRWLAEHISSTIGSGIAVYTAFFAFGARQWFNFLGDWQLLAWLVPGLVGTFVIFWATRRYVAPTRAQRS
ncbi:hypothetical protein [Pseudidiomarina terrestris]|uniref:DUF2306 domain-containing protein n=1 Tax=Pseudidiomarina terrestris TaxID=2820060 RepID=A0AAW7R466_9GAMM|nr:MULTISPECIES: hypothetical protein [unclassified Pseudidiomarina]MDN7125470.1 hypothetical protein [Pseudidiomarina sp. 1APP75-32.1]MDN7128099.1 hypothetical protein [Pseudidiomarina sp. 1APR75-33.1]MDN7130228.1 hypothetical protein [Pseudidiomarina sp. 1APR75-15]MDN7135737.1 hypothetical protein [Pseudidiomarina sp. 1ASP75-5]MDN7137226.1 hypothetical protein [Pseudidiomarina sp. 1ASP75-14]